MRGSHCHHAHHATPTTATGSTLPLQHSRKESAAWSGGSKGRLLRSVAAATTPLPARHSKTEYNRGGEVGVFGQRGTVLAALLSRGDPNIKYN